MITIYIEILDDYQIIPQTLYGLKSSKAILINSVPI